MSSLGYEDSFGYGERLKNLRLRTGLTQRDLAEKVGLKRESTYISLVEREARVPSDALIDRVIGLFKDLLGADADEGDSLRQEVAEAHRRQEARSREQFIQRRRARAQARNDVKPVLTAGRTAVAPDRYQAAAPETEDSLDDETVRVVRYVARADPEFGRFLLGMCYWHLNRSDPEAGAKALEWLRDSASRRFPGLE